MESYVFKNSAGAERLLEGMREFLSLYGFVTREDVNLLYGTPSKPNDNKFGWLNLDNAYIESDFMRLEFVLVLPKAKPIS